MQHLQLSGKKSRIHASLTCLLSHISMHGKPPLHTVSRIYHARGMKGYVRTCSMHGAYTSINMHDNIAVFVCVVYCWRRAAVNRVGVMLLNNIYNVPTLHSTILKHDSNVRGRQVYLLCSMVCAGQL